MKLHFQPTTPEAPSTEPATPTRRPAITRAERDRRVRAEMGRFASGRRPLGSSWLRSSTTDSWWTSAT